MSGGLNLESVTEDLETYVHGIEINGDEVQKCVKNLDKTASAYGVEGVHWDVKRADTLTVTEYDGRMDFVLGNPPYVRVHNFGENLGSIKKFSFAQEGMTDLYIVFFEIGLRMLSPSGVLGYITPSSYFGSLAGARMRRALVDGNLLDKVVDLKHFQAFDATTYTAITILRNDKKDDAVEYYLYDADNFRPVPTETLTADDYYISKKFYFGKRGDIKLLKRILRCGGQSGIEVKNGYATLCDSVFISDFDFPSKYIIPVIKASTGACKRIFFPYDKNSRRIPMSEIIKEPDLYRYLYSNRDKLLRRSNENDSAECWYLFGRSQGIGDTFKDKLSINAMLRCSDDWKIVFAPSGTGIYSGLYITSSTIDYSEIKKALEDDEFILYISLLGKYKSGGYYTFSSKDVKAYLDYKFACEKEVS
ncbi:MAG: N-6 DNA methylase [Clostridia bacterium]|nr:N-6 DNA methylase [Clostridia bacterium]